MKAMSSFRNQMHQGDRIWKAKVMFYETNQKLPSVMQTVEHRMLDKLKNTIAMDTFIALYFNRYP